MNILVSTLTLQSLRIFLEDRSRAGSQKTKGKVVDKFSSGYIENSLEDDGRHVVLSVNEWSKSNTGSFSTSVKLNVYNGQQKKLGKSPLAGGQVRYR